ncbi:MAG: 4'-phosphopantetheinyl transferase superfamily protein [Pseudomonadota bacterium]
MNNVLQSPFHGVFCISLDLMCYQQGLLSCLSSDEKARMQRYRQPDDARRHLLAHGFKRLLLSRLLAVAPQALSFSANPRGKPRCDTPNAPWFNLSHSGDWVIVGISEFAEIGVDVECVQRQTSEGVVNTVLSDEQRQRVQAAANPEQVFMYYWTQKEAISKAIGMGLSVDFQTLACCGQLGRSESPYDKQTIYLQTGLLGGDYVLSIASASPQDALIYRVDSWDSCHPIVL